MSTHQDPSSQAAPAQTGEAADRSPRPSEASERRAVKLGRILDVAKALGSERDFTRLMDTILEAAKEVVEADRLSLYIVDRERGELWTKIAQGMGAQEIRIPLGVGIAGVVAQTREPLVIPDAYADPRFNRNVDLKTGYRTRNILTVPMLNIRAEATGVIQALNKAGDRDFTDEDRELLMALGGQAAVAVENTLLHQDIERLFEGFIRASVYAIEARDPTTSGHSERVAVLTVALAETLPKVRAGPWAGVSLSPHEVRELRYAALLHDFGKVGVRENVLTKANKLYPGAYDTVRQRFELCRRTREMEHWRRKAQLLERGRATPEELDALDARLAVELASLDEVVEFIGVCNRPTVLEEGGFERLQDIARISFEDARGQPTTLLTEEEVADLSLRRGSLNSAERREIESHVTHTFRFLRQIPWTTDLKRVPEFAHAHHEHGNGKGYPRGLVAADIPVQAKMMTVTDIYDALTASDRPYKRAVPHARAVDILNEEAGRGVLDRDLVNLFVDAEVHRALAPPPR
jgi:HD-GYP domain-containing protein (c-di-GMP phosphodiesterase class II)